MTARATARRLVWRAGRLLYMGARGEERAGDMAHNGEAALQRHVIAALADRPSIHVMDIGANLGLWTTLLLSHVGAGRFDPGRLQLDVFEPAPETRERLARNLAGIENGGLARVHPEAMSDAEGRASIALYGEGGGTNTLHPDGSEQPSGHAEIERTTLAGFCERNGISHIDFIKIDTEGHDFCVLSGAKPLLEAGRIGVLQFEYNHRWIFAKCYLKDVFDLIEGLPYRLARLRPQWIEIYETWHPEMERFFQCNYVVVHRDLVGRLPNRVVRAWPDNTFA